MERTLYHDSEFIIKKTEFLKGNIHNDYEIGFYCKTNKELAKEWAAKRSGKGYINKYILRDDRLKILDGIYMKQIAVLMFVRLKILFQKNMQII